MDRDVTEKERYTQGRGRDSGREETEEERLEKNLLTPAERKDRLNELLIAEEHALKSYQWVDKEKGVVRLPIDRAMELVVRDAQAKK